MKLKTFIANAVRLPHVPDCDVAANGGRQFTVAARCQSRHDFMRLLMMSASHAQHCGLHISNDFEKVCPKPNTPYYHCDTHGSPNFNQWIEYQPL